jgi:SAM-dependent methyltransferase
LYPSDQVEQGEYRISEPDVTEMGDVSGLRLLHLQCNAGADTLFWASQGAIVTGIDFSEVAIQEARRLSKARNLGTTFIHSDLYELRSSEIGTFDVVYTSTGVLWWLPDLKRWAEIIAELLEPGGTFYIDEIHPVAGALADRDGAFVFAEAYFSTGDPIVFESDGTYYETSPGFAAEAGTECGWIHTLGDIVTSLCEAGLVVEFLHEHPFAHFRMHPSLQRGDDGLWRSAPDLPDLPLTFSLKARRVTAKTEHSRAAGDS